MDFEKLIECVRNYPVLYDSNNPDYMKTKLKDELFEKIGVELSLDGKAVKEQWKKLRECHREALRRQKKKKSGDAAVRQKPWIYQSQMEFLLPYMKNRSTLSNLPSTSESTPSIAEEEEEDEAHVPGEEGILSSQKEEIVVPTKTRKIRSERPLLQQFIRSTEKRIKHRDEIREQLLKQGPQNQNDALYNFFLSMYATTKRLSPRLQRQVRKKVFEAVTEAEEDNDLETSQASCSTSSTFTSKSLIQEELSQEFPEFFQQSQYTTDNSQPNETVLQPL